MNQHDPVVIVGGGLAGATAAFALRERGIDGRIVIVSEEPQLPYERPPLSKTYLRGEEPLEKAFVKQASDYDAQSIELLSGRRAVQLDPISRRVNLDDGTDLPYGALLLATGSAPRRLDVEGGDLAGIHLLRTAPDADSLRAAAADAKAIVVVGSGWIGTEVAASLTQMGHAVTLVSDTDQPLQRVLGTEIGKVYAELHTAHGVTIVNGKVSSLEGEERVTGVRLADGQVLIADLVVVGIGAIPRTKLALRGGLEIKQGGIAVDEYLRTSVPSIYAAGDIAAAWHPRFGRHIRVEHWDNAIQQALTAAANIAGANEPYTRTPYFYSDQFDLGMEYRGFAPERGRVVVRGDVAKREFLAFWLADGRVVAAMNANLWDFGDELTELVESERRIDPDRLTDPDVPLAEAA
jgi:3-phenylpropionate/trans-cinnamate dioxygenase ferredoxin reductase subunit